MGLGSGRTHTRTQVFYSQIINPFTLYIFSECPHNIGGYLPWFLLMNARDCILSILRTSQHKLS